MSPLYILLGLNPDLIKPDQIRTNHFKSNKIGSKETKLDQVGSNHMKLDIFRYTKNKNCQNLGVGDTPALSFALLSLIIEKLGLSLYVMLENLVF